MRIGIDNISPGESTNKQGPGGMRMYLQALLTEFARLAPQHELVLFTPDWADPLLETTPDSVEIVRLPGVPFSRAGRVLYQQIAFGAALAWQRLDVFLATATIAPLLCPAPIVLAVQFLQFYQWPEAYSRVRTAYLKLILPLSLRKARRAIIFTEAAKHDLIHYTGVAADKVAVVPHGLQAQAGTGLTPDSARATMAGLTNGHPYILYVSATYGYKNHLRLIRAFAQFKQQTRLPHVLLLVGSEVAVPFAALRAEAARSGVASDVIIAGRLESVTAAYTGADLTVIPTLYETFGFPVLEAMACGSPVVTSSLGSMAELAEDAAVLVDPLDEAALAAGLTRVLSDTALRQRLIVRGFERAAQFTWARTAAKTLAIIEEVARR